MRPASKWSVPKRNVPPTRNSRRLGALPRAPEMPMGVVSATVRRWGDGALDSSEPTTIDGSPSFGAIIAGSCGGRSTA